MTAADMLLRARPAALLARPAALLARPAALLARAAGLQVAPSAAALSSRPGGGGTTARLGETSVFVQNGKKISELPVVVKKVNDVFELYRRLGLRGGPAAEEPAAAAGRLSEEEREVIEGFGRCSSSSGMFRLLETIPGREVTPQVAAAALRKLVELEAGHLAPAHDGAGDTVRAVTRRPDTFLRIAFVSQLVDIIGRSRDPAVILDGLNSAMRAGCPGDRAAYKARLLEELLDGVTEGLFSLQQICQAIGLVSTVFSDRKRSLETADKLWMGLMDKGQQLTSGEDIATVFSCLPHLGRSRDMVLRLLERRVMEHWQGLRTGHVIEIFRVLTDLQYERVSPAFLRTLSGWLSLHIHTVSEQEMLAILWGNLHLDYTDDAIIKAVEKMIRVKGLQITEADLISTICSYCSHFRIRSPVILEGVGQYFLEHGARLEPAQVCALSLTFGTLDFHPANGFKFWELLEHYLENNFVKFAPLDMINMLVSFIYLERYPLNFTNKIFNPFFMERLHDQPEELVAVSREELKLFDSAMTLACPGYQGPFLPKNTNYKPMRQDMAVVRLSGRLLEPLADVVGDMTRLGRLVVLSALPLHPLYVVELMVYPSHSASLLRFGRSTNNSSNTAVLILAPDHYDRSGRQLVGAQVMRVRHLRLMGFKVMLVKLSLASQLLMHPKKLREYLQEQYEEALKPSEDPT